MRTPIHTSKKLEKLVRKLVTTNINEEQARLGKWNATVFYVDRKKCWLVTNAMTQYNVILIDIKAADLNSIEEIFKNTFYTQLTYDGIITDYNKVDMLIGNLDFLPTDNDRKTTGFQNHRLHELDWWKYEFGNLENMPIKDLANRINTTPIHIGNGKRLNFTTSIDEIEKLLLE